MATSELATLALDTRSWSLDRAAQLEADPAAAIAALKAREVPLNGEEPAGGRKAGVLKQSLGVLGVKIAPTMSQDQAEAWTTAVAMALADLPAAFSIRGAKDALHVPMKFLNEVEGVVREKAEDARVRHQAAIYRLRQFERQIRAATKPALPKPEVPEMTQEAINAMPRSLLDLGLKLGHLTQEQYDIATRKDEDQ